MNDFQHRFPELYQFFGGYFYQGWVSDYRWENESANFSSVVRHFKAINPPVTVAKVRNELEIMLLQEFDEVMLKEALNELGSNFYPAGENLSYSQWLEKILEILYQSAGKDRILREIH